MIGSATLVGLMLAWVVSRGLTRPIVRLQTGARAVSAGMLSEAHVPVTTRDEIGDVTRAFNAMISDLQEKEKVKETFGQYVDPRIVAGLLDGGQSATEGKKQVASIFFSDIVGFSGISEQLAPGTLVKLMNAYFSAMSDPIQKHSGIVDKYIGDAIMAFWVPPFVEAQRQAELACRAALKQIENLDAFHRQTPDIIGLRRDVPLIDFRSGIVTGEVVVGSVGSEIARSFTAMGDCVNQASRLEAVNKIYGTRVLIDHPTRCAAGDAIEAREVDLIRVPGVSVPLRIYELAALKGGLSSSMQELFTCYEEGLHWYRAARWDQAAVAFNAALNIDPQDKPSRVMLERTTNAHTALPSDWDGVWVMSTKL
jgi:class 3 adenylate cyclase